jgi:ketosteroid isomerase-like protein
MLQRTVAASRRGDIEPHLRNCAEDVEFVFPGQSSWTQHSHTKAELRPWLERFARVGLQFYADRIDVKGPPWNTRVYITFHDHLDAPDGARVYVNTGVMVARIRWAKTTYIKVIEDTQQVAALDEWLSVNEAR